MRRLLFSLALILASRAVSACECITMIPTGLHVFTRADVVVHARWNGIDTMRVESVVIGDAKPGAAIAYKPRSCCEMPGAGQLYLVVHSCHVDQCAYRTVDEKYVPALMRYREDAHPETHERVLAQAIAWGSGSLSTAEFLDWLSNVSAEPRTPDEEDYVSELVPELERIARWYDELPLKGKVVSELMAFVYAARQIPSGTMDDFDAHVIDNGDERPLYFWEYEKRFNQAMETLEEAIDANTTRPEKHP